MEWCIENLKKQYKSIDEYSELPEEFSILSRSIYDMKEFIRKAKMYSGSIYIREEQCSLKEILKESTVIPVETAGEITIGSNIQDDVFVYCDKVHMSETLSNIILNSVESISQAGKINIDGAFDKRKAYYLLTVTDNGMGMTRENIKNIFMPYYTTKNSEKNFGLGLTYCLNVIKKHGGYIKVKSKLGIGTTVIIAIPARRVSYIKMEDMPLCQIE
jgi:signal transduction histidine kinase